MNQRSDQAKVTRLRNLALIAALAFLAAGMMIGGPLAMNQRKRLKSLNCEILSLQDAIRTVQSQIVETQNQITKSQQQIRAIQSERR